jgi:hypothetical protein
MSRTVCIVPFCNRSRAVIEGEEYCEWVCGNHWPLAPRHMKSVLFRLHRRIRRRPKENLLRREARVWARIKRAIIARAAGIG